jgi:ribose transport system substrate-binding protein
MKRAVVFLAVLTLLIAGAFAQKKPVFGYAVQDLGNQYWVTVANGIKAKAAELGVDVVVMDARTDPARELANVEDLAQRKVQAILLSPWDTDSGSNAVAVANKAKIPVFVLDIGVKSGKIETFIVSDNYKGGRIAGEYIKKYVPAGGKVAHIQCQLGYVIPGLRGKGFSDVMTESKIIVAARQPANSQRAMGMDVMQNILQSNPDIGAVFCENDEMALGAIEAIAAVNKQSQIKVIGFDGTNDALDAIKAGRLTGSVAQQPFEMGKMGVQAAYDFLHGKKVEKETFVPVKLITKDSL